MAELLPDVPDAYCGLWERTLLERYSDGSLTSDRPAQVFWMQTPLFHCDLRVPLDRPDFSGIGGVDACSDAQLAFIAGQEAFFGITRVDGIVCTWLRLFDLRPGTALDIGRMEFHDADLLFERGIAEDYLEHWSRRTGSIPVKGQPSLQRDGSGRLLLTSGNWRMRLAPRLPAPTESDPYAPLDRLDRAALAWRASLEVTLCEKRADGWTAVLSTHPWVEGKCIEDATAPADGAMLPGKAVAS